jgi:hypothetical protein
MYTNEEQSQLNKFLEHETFTMDTDFFGGDSKFEFEYKFKLVGTKKMMSVGEYYDYIRVFVTIVGGEDRFKRLLKVISYVQKINERNFLEEFLKKEYGFSNQLNRDISDNLKYFSDGKDHVRVQIESITITDNFFSEVKNIDLNL